MNSCSRPANPQETGSIFPRWDVQRVAVCQKRGCGKSEINKYQVNAERPHNQANRSALGVDVWLVRENIPDAFQWYYSNHYSCLTSADCFQHWKSSSVQKLTICQVYFFSIVLAGCYLSFLMLQKASCTKICWCVAAHSCWLETEKLGLKSDIIPIYYNLCPILRGFIDHLNVLCSAK